MERGRVKSMSPALAVADRVVAADRRMSDRPVADRHRVTENVPQAMNQAHRGTASGLREVVSVHHKESRGHHQGSRDLPVMDSVAQGTKILSQRRLFNTPGLATWS